MSNLSLASGPLTPKMRAFVKFYVLYNDGMRAAIEAGYGKKNAAVQAAKLLQHPGVKREIGKAMSRLNKEYKEKLDTAMQELFHCLTRRGTDLVDPETNEMLPLHDMPERANAAIDGYEEEESYDKQGNKKVKRKVKLVSKATAIDMAMKITGAYAPEKHINANTSFDISDLYGMPQGALDDDVIEDPKLEEK